MKINNFGDVQEFLSEIPHINRGGCGIASLAMFLWLKKNKELRKRKIKRHVFMTNTRYIKSMPWYTEKKKT